MRRDVLALVCQRLDDTTPYEGGRLATAAMDHGDDVRLAALDEWYLPWTRGEWQGDYLLRHNLYEEAQR